MKPQARDKVASRSDGEWVSRQGKPGDGTESEQRRTLAGTPGAEHGTEAPAHSTQVGLNPRGVEIDARA